VEILFGFSFSESQKDCSGKRDTAPKKNPNIAVGIVFLDD